MLYVSPLLLPFLFLFDFVCAGGAPCCTGCCVSLIPTVEYSTPTQGCCYKSKVSSLFYIYHGNQRSNWRQVVHHNYSLSLCYWKCCHSRTTSGFNLLIRVQGSWKSRSESLSHKDIGLVIGDPL
ncbi:uncharacterized protein LOC124845005 [Vigna umbellata]|uniref:uncharacterized protein LOC124845005 n=1 Tax=Vigna umbellata TaxID=87088 RepID=UPI001F5F3B90|nr:uncharacterized protein LOC124845005 [Vigna umbellata]